MSNYVNDGVLKNLAISCFILIFIVITSLTAIDYPGNRWMYFFFSGVSFAIGFFAFSKKAIFFDIFMAIFLLLGFWIKLSAKILFFDLLFGEPIGFFNYSAKSFDLALFVSSVGMLGFLLASYIRSRLFSYLKAPKFNNYKALEIYKKHRLSLISVLIIIVLFISITNFCYGIYQRGEISDIDGFFMIMGLYKWLLLFGMASFFATILRYEILLKRTIPIVILACAFLECLFSNTSMLSRGMILNASSILLGVLFIKNKFFIKSTLKSYFYVAILFFVIFISSFQVVNFLRVESVYSDTYNSNDTQIELEKKAAIANMNRSIFLDRWVGIEGVMAVISRHDLGFDLIKESFEEKFDQSKLSFYDKHIIKDSPYSEGAKSTHHYISLPGLIAYLFYSGSFLFLFLACATIGLLASFIEYLACKFTKANFIFASLIGQVLAYRLSCFGYVPAQTYLLISAIILNIFFLYLLEKGVHIIWVKKIK